MARDKRRSGQLNRRAFIGASLSAPLLAACDSSSSVSDGTQPSECDGPLDTPFRHGIASGDPLSDRLILWTRISQDDMTAPAEVSWLIATDPALNNIVATGQISTGPERDHTVKIDVTGLSPATTYYYRFSAHCADSAIGRAKTLPVGTVERARIALVSCASLPHGFFHAYQRIAERQDLDFVLHLGDYIYEYPGVDPSAPDPEDYADQAAIDAGRIYSEDNRVETVSLTDYRRRHANYKRDPQLTALHRQYAFITIWDDHEFADNTWRDGANNHQPDEDGDWALRSQAARQAYFEWMPIREASAGDIERIDRRFQLGDLVDLQTLDTRWIGRDALGEGLENPSGLEIFRDAGVVADPTRNLIDGAQETALNDLLINSPARWKLIAQQVVFAQWKLVGAANATNLETPGGQGGQFLNLDQWDGYPRNRERIWQTIRDNAVSNTVFLTGDVHSSWAHEITEDPNNPLSYGPLVGGSMAVEFVCTSVTSPGAFPDTALTVDAFITQNPHVKYGELTERGYMILDITPQRCQGEWWYVDDHLDPSASEESLGAVWQTEVDSNALSTGEVSSPRENAPPFAP